VALVRFREVRGRRGQKGGDRLEIPVDPPTSNKFYIETMDDNGTIDIVMTVQKYVENNQINYVVTNVNNTKRDTQTMNQQPTSADIELLNFVNNFKGNFFNNKQLDIKFYTYNDDRQKKLRCIFKLPNSSIKRHAPVTLT
jgi:hypothetical protein